MWVISKITWNDRWSHVPLFRSTNILKIYDLNKCIGDDTKDAARQSPNCIKKNKIWRKTIFNMADGLLTSCNVARSWHWFRQVTVPCKVAWLWNHDSEFTKWQHPAMWYVALGWHGVEFGGGSTLQCSGITTANSPCGSTLQCDTWLWDDMALNLAVAAPCNVACGSGITTANSPSSSTLQCDTWLWDDMALNLAVAAPCNVAWLWNHDSEFTK